MGEKNGNDLNTIEGLFVADYKRRGEDLIRKDKRIADLETQSSLANKRANELEDLIVSLRPIQHKDGAVYFDKNILWKDEVGYPVAARFAEKEENKHG